MSLLQRVKQRLLRLVDRARASDGTRFYSQTGEDAILAHLLFDHDCGFYVDVGAFHPIQYSNTYYFYRRGWTGINIEPTPGQIDLFMREQAERYQSRVCSRQNELTCKTPATLIFCENETADAGTRNL